MIFQLAKIMYRLHTCNIRSDIMCIEYNFKNHQKSVLFKLNTMFLGENAKFFFRYNFYLFSTMQPMPCLGETGLIFILEANIPGLSKGRLDVISWMTGL